MFRLLLRCHNASQEAILNVLIEESEEVASTVLSVYKAWKDYERRNDDRSRRLREALAPYFEGTDLEYSDA